jgi:hypothetical protein
LSFAVRFAGVLRFVGKRLPLIYFVMAAVAAAIHTHRDAAKSWMAGTSPAMTDKILFGWKKF